MQVPVLTKRITQCMNVIGESQETLYEFYYWSMWKLVHGTIVESFFPTCSSTTLFPIDNYSRTTLTALQSLTTTHSFLRNSQCSSCQPL